MLSQKDLQERGSSLAILASGVGLSALSDEDAKTLSLYEDWKDGADWEVLPTIESARSLAESKSYLMSVYGYNQ
jgi:hypothetical protein